MKEKTNTITALLLAMLFTGVTGLAAKTEYVIGVQGLSCPFCAYGLEKKLKALEGVETVSIDMNENQAVITADRAIDEKKIRGAVKDAGFSVSSLEKKGPESEVEKRTEGAR